ncbi:hypothetical protein [Nocardioides mesophilus]|uniref:DUF4386 domain-containing protein n=1 Tax=Nocardioides mesophilus TaxID=433659 RepID=A0A7G9R6W7_9ACTN|nr:hypothetical protein [Nocardioides mesophilus]QNN51342.1 hypothetical protein H9L09_12010 [Nocardioides mesophilus]
MKSAYRYLALSVPVLVAVQASMITFGTFGIFSYLEDDKSYSTSVAESGDVAGAAGQMIHGLLGTAVIPLIALILLALSFFAKVPGGTKWAGFILLDVVAQVLLAFTAFGAPVVGVLHGLNAFLLFGLGMMAAQAARQPSAVAQEHAVA